jgi:2-C-methyl-D-erythritol 4-phosphate cytidylyltransferase
VVTVEGSADNIKLTRGSDFAIAEALLRERG